MGTDRPDRRAWHLAFAADGPDEEAAAALETVALEARSRSGRPAAAAAFERAALLSASTDARLRRAVEAAGDWLLAGDFQQARSLLDEVLPEVEDPLFRAHVQTLRARVELIVGGPMAAHSLLVEEAHRIEVAHPNTAAGMLAEAAFSCYTTGNAKRGLSTAERALDLAQREPGASLPLVWLTYAEGLFLTGEARSAEPLLDQALPMIAQADLSQVYELMQAPALSLIYLERFDESRQLLERVDLDGSRTKRSDHAAARRGRTRAACAPHRDWTLATASLTESIELGQQMQMWNVLPFTIGIAAQLAAVQGRDDECRQLGADAYRIGGPLMSMALLHYVESAFGLLESSYARYDEAIKHLEPVARNCDEAGLEDPGIVTSGPDLIEAYAHTDGPRMRSTRSRHSSVGPSTHNDPGRSQPPRAVEGFSQTTAHSSRSSRRRSTGTIVARCRSSARVRSSPSANGCAGQGAARSHGSRYATRSERSRRWARDRGPNALVRSSGLQASTRAGARPTLLSV